MEQYSWNSPIVAEVAWGKSPDEDGYEMYQHRKPARAGNPIRFDYTFRKEDGTIIDLSPYYGAVFLAKKDGALSITGLASINQDKTTGKVYCENFRFTSDGLWTIQFMVQDGAGHKVKGDPATIKIGLNVDEIPADGSVTY